VTSIHSRLGAGAPVLLLALLFGLLACYVDYHWSKAQGSILTKCAIGVDISFRAKVLSANEVASEHWRLAVQVISLGTDTCVDSIDGMKLRATWKTSLLLSPGEFIDITGRFKRPWGTANSGSFDYQRWLLANGYSGTGYVRSGKLLLSEWRPVNNSAAALQDLDASAAKLRGRVAATLDQSGLVYAPILSALAIGATSGLQPKDWSIFRATGTIHLMVISGLHIAVIAFLAFWICKIPLGLLLSFVGTRIDHQIALLCALLITFAFAVITGLGAPALRVCLMLMFGLLANYLGRKPPFWYLLGLAFCLSLIIQPLSFFSQGFWLSYFAVAGLIWAFSPRSKSVGPVFGFLLAQVAIFLWLTPLLGILVGEVSLLSIPANLLALPIITVVTLPALILGLSLYFVAPDLAIWLLYLADFSIALIYAWLAGLQSVVPEYSRTFGYFSLFVALVGFIACLFMFVPILLVKRLAIFLPFLLLFLARENSPYYGEYCLRIVDVGQGSAVVVDTSAHRLVLDAGPLFASGFDAAVASVIPTIRSTGIDRLDKILVSHTDLDHAGGVASLRKRYQSGAIIGLDKQCIKGESWTWDGVKFLLVVDHSQPSRNDRSCTLLIRNDRTKAYLSGDIGAKAEASLLLQLPRDIDFLLAPHHGSGNSSSYRFARYLSPRWVAYSAGYMSQYGHPHKRTKARYRLEDSGQIGTAQHGALRWCSSLSDQVLSQRYGTLVLGSLAGLDLLGAPDD